MSKPNVSASFAVVESSENLMKTLDAHKTSLAFPVISVPARPGDVGDFMGIISRTRCGSWDKRVSPLFVYPLFAASTAPGTQCMACDFMGIINRPRCRR
jgi:hypothetical protein